MRLSDALVRKLRQKYTPQSVIDMRFNGRDVVFKTDGEGNPVVLFIGRMLPGGKIKGERYSRVLKKDDTGSVFRDHWDLKGKAD